MAKQHDYARGERDPRHPDPLCAVCGQPRWTWTHDDPAEVDAILREIAENEAAAENYRRTYTDRGT
jgi:hypothetical protein